MRRSAMTAKLALLLASILLAATIARADKIVLKNGRKILAYNVVEDGDKIRYETSAGQLSLPKSIVDHIERGGLLPMMESPAAAAANLSIAPAAMESTSTGMEIDRKAVHDGGIDRNYIAQLEAEARAGSPRANERAAIALYAASQFELSHENLEHALRDQRAAANYWPDQPALLLSLAYLHLRRSEFKQSLEYVERVKRLAPDNADAYKLAGWAFYGMNQPDKAVSQWERALSLHPDDESKAALEKAQRDKREEEHYLENESVHFQLKYNGTAEPELAREVLHTLESHYEQMASELNYEPPAPVGVVLYTQARFADTTHAPDWAGALNDGRIRVRVQGLSRVNSDLSRVLRHELTHSFIEQKTHGRAPTWIQEGLAQWMEGKRSDENVRVLLQVYEQGQSAPLGKLEGSWVGLSEEVARYSYAWSLANIEYIVQTQGMGDVVRILDRIAAGGSTEDALHYVLHDDYSDLMQATAEYLKKTYGR
jgi:tetratricopeptide (TPR) repeat protein